ncbi:TIM barrel protein [Pseudarthrobacter sp. NamE2]|uniref:sugar phosphate isomerase/epimerase family protein n=1 Tax=Pseudarthrobacter sp. NamE2 TaxID=2576838 RepID=UPI0010FE52AF|nr:TIM barrel protein [Pseudarthrobacter sp. NamE2]TLM83596.1 TIM barrel protein [Pseudarthrobacter sp. NamE2]
MTATATTSRALPGTDIKLGLTLYSLTNEWVTGQYSLESLIARVAEAGIGPGVEVVGFQTIRNYPAVSDDFVRSWRALLDQYELEPSCLAVNTDVALRRDRMLTDDEIVDYLARQIETAHRLGFPTVRTQMGGSTAVLEPLLRRVEQYGIKLGMEIHAPEGPNTPTVMRVREAYEQIDSPLLGFIPDFSSTMRGVPAPEIDYFVRLGLPRAAGDELETIWAESGNPQERFGRFAELARSKGASDEALRAVHTAFSMHGHEPVDSWREIMPQIVHVHGKFYDINAAGEEPSIDIPAIMRIFVEAGYAGYFSSEWEGHAFRDVGEVDPIALIQGQHRLIVSAVRDAVADR